MTNEHKDAALSLLFSSAFSVITYLLIVIFH